MKTTIEIEASQYKDDKTGRDIVRFTPFLRPSCVASGTLRFAYFEVWATDAPDIHADAMNRATRGAKSALQSLSEEAA